VRDEALGAEPLSVLWTLHPDAPAASLSVEGPSSVLAAREGDTRAWFSPGYGERLPARAVHASGRALAANITPPR
jgi:hypothetical protein